MEIYVGKRVEGICEPSPVFLVVYCAVWEFLLLQLYVIGIMRQHVA